MTRGPVLTATAVLAVLLAAGCGGGSSETGSSAEKPAQLPPRPAPPAAQTPATATPAAPAGSAAAAAGAEADLSALEDIPTTEQLEQLLDQSVTEENADAEFEKLQKELEAEEEGG